MIKILVDAHVFDHSFQGTASYIKGLYLELVKYSDVEITLCGNDLEKLRTVFNDSRFQYIKLHSHSRMRRLISEIPSIIRQHNFDYAHFQFLTPFIKNCKFINTIHDLLFLSFKSYFPWTYRFSRKYLFYLSAKKSDILLTVSEYSKKEIAKIYSIPEQQIHVTPNAVDIFEGEYFSIKKKYNLRNYLLFVSRFEPRKNHCSLLNAYINLGLSEKGYDLVFIGSKNEPIEEEAYARLVDQIPISLKKNIFFFESLSWAELHSFYRDAECFVYPSLAEGFGIPPIEAAMNNTKVVCSNQTAMRDFDFFPYRFDPLTNELDAVLEQALLDNNYPYEKIRVSIFEKYNWARIAADFHQLLTEDYRVQKEVISISSE